MNARIEIVKDSNHYSATIVVKRLFNDMARVFCLVFGLPTLGSRPNFLKSEKKIKEIFFTLTRVSTVLGFNYVFFRFVFSTAASWLIKLRPVTTPGEI